MKKNRSVIIAFGVIFGLICFFVSVFFLPPYYALILGALTASLSMLIFGLMSDKNFNKYKNIENIIDFEFVLSDSANYYSDRLIANGIVYLTKDRLIFISYEKKTVFREEISFDSIKKATYGKIFRHINGVKLLMADSSIKGFAMKDIEEFLDGINNIINPCVNKSE